METRREGLVGQQGRAQLGAAVIKGRGDSKWAARVVLEVRRRSSSLLPDDSGADEAALAAQGIEAAHGIGVSGLGGLTEEAVEILVGVDVSASSHLEGNRLALHAMPDPVVPDLSRHQPSEVGSRVNGTGIVRESSEKNKNLQYLK